MLGVNVESLVDEHSVEQDISELMLIGEYDGIQIFFGSLKKYDHA
jgi:hypothetical protein